ncbi:MAG: SUMF1/EgtB/PvdO family nonheme iron enzyme [Saprospiraceae bacterium]|nr:SUMF1/EgtB/PvdO family nonheme iron enzyme [Saprospiraceae bacterium]
MRILLFLLLLSPALSRAAVSLVLVQTFEERLREAERSGDREAVAAICREWYASGKFSPGVLDWNYNALMSVEDNSILFTFTDTDTYPAMLLQNALEVRPDVTVLNLGLLDDAGYRQVVARTRNYSWLGNTASRDQFVGAVLKASSDYGEAYFPVYFGVMTDPALLRADQSQLYLTGLALKYNSRSFDNVALLRFNYENRFRTDYLQLRLQPDPEAELVARLNLNYIPSLLLLHQHYSAAGETAKAADVEQLAFRIGRTANREAEVRALFQPETDPAALQSIIPLRSLEKPMKKIGPKLYAADTEVTNEQYELFLQDMVKNKAFEQLQTCRTTRTDWRSLLAGPHRQLSDAVLFKHGHPDDPGAPVQNISHEAAQAYCDWITQVYNNSPGKKKFKKVVFRLPDNEEWMLAASGGLKDTPYPWPGGYYVRNSKGCYLCNINAVEPCGDCPEGMKNESNDGGFFPVPANSYYPNGFGLYCVAGNVAEMLREPGKTKGGSWLDEPFWCQIPNVHDQAAPSPAVGFRVFMEVVEE